MYNRTYTTFLHVVNVSKKLGTCTAKYNSFLNPGIPHTLVTNDSLLHTGTLGLVTLMKVLMVQQKQLIMEPSCTTAAHYIQLLD